MANSALNAINGQLSEDQLDTIARTILGEAMPYDEPGQQAVAWVIRNRAASGDFPSDPAKVAKQPKQFSAWNSGAGGNDLVRMSASSPRYQQAYQIAKQVFSGGVADPTGGATYYHTPAVNPKWDNRMTKTAEVGGHVFYTPSGGHRLPEIPRQMQPPSDAMFGVNRLNPGQRTPVPDMTPGQNYGVGARGVVNDPNLMGMLRPQVGQPGMSASGMSGGVPPMSGRATMQAPSGAMTASGMPPQMQQPASVSMQAPPPMPRPRPSMLDAPGNGPNAATFAPPNVSRETIPSRSVQTVPVSASGMPANTTPSPMQRPPSLFGERGQMIAAGMSSGNSGQSTGNSGKVTMNAPQTGTRPLSQVVAPSTIPMSERVPRSQPPLTQADVERKAAQMAAAMPPKPTPTWSSAPPSQIAAYGAPPPMPPSIPQIPQVADLPGANGTTDPNKDPSQLQPSPPGNEFAYGSGIPQLPAVAAIGQATMPPMPRPRPTPPTTLPNGMPVDNSVPLNASTYRQPQFTQYRPAPPPTPQLVTLASGKTVPVGTTGTAQGGRYKYQVQSDGTVINTATGKPAGYSPAGQSMMDFLSR